MESRSSRKELLLIGCGAFAVQAHLPALAACSDEVRLAAVVDAAESERAIRESCRRAGLPADFAYVGLPELERHQTGAGVWVEPWSRLPAIDAVIISSPELTHKPYLEWALHRRLPTLVDKPLTLGPDSSQTIRGARCLLQDFDRYTAAAASVHPVMLAAQRRYQPAYRGIGAWLHQSFEATSWPVTFIQCLTNDGLWLQPDDYPLQPTYRSGGGKLVHTGYHLLDQLPWLMRHCQMPGNDDAPVRRIASARVFATMFRPADSVVLRGHGPARADAFELLPEINAGLQVAFRDAEGRTLCILQIAALHEGLSLNCHPPGADLAGRTRAANAGRTKQDVLTIYQGPAVGIFLRRIAKLDGPGAQLGQRDHLELLCASHPRLLPESPALQRLDLVYEHCDSEPTLEFIRALGNRQAEVASPVSDHGIAIALLSAAYESAITQQAIEVAFDPGQWDLPPGAAAYMFAAPFDRLRRVATEASGV